MKLMFTQNMITLFTDTFSNYTWIIIDTESALNSICKSLTHKDCDALRNNEVLVKFTDIRLHPMYFVKYPTSP